MKKDEPGPKEQIPRPGSPRLSAKVYQREPFQLLGVKPTRSIAAVRPSA